MTTFPLQSTTDRRLLEQCVLVQDVPPPSPNEVVPPPSSPPAPPLLDAPPPSGAAYPPPCELPHPDATTNPPSTISAPALANPGFMDTRATPREGTPGASGGSWGFIET